MDLKKVGKMIIYLVFLFPRPMYLPLRVLFTAESFSLSSNIIVDTATFHLRYSPPLTEHDRGPIKSTYFLNAVSLYHIIWAGDSV